MAPVWGWTSSKTSVLCSHKLNVIQNAEKGQSIQVIGDGLDAFDTFFPPLTTGNLAAGLAEREAETQNRS